LQENGVDYVSYMYKGAHHGFHNDTTPRYDENAAALAWKRTLEHFNRHLKPGMP
jgi:carboxymethylenebutenolidase